MERWYIPCRTRAAPGSSYSLIQEISHVNVSQVRTGETIRSVMNRDSFLNDSESNPEMIRRIKIQLG